MEPIIYNISGNIPSKKNSRINTRSGRSFPSKNYQAWHSITFAQIKGQFDHDTLEEIREIKINLVFPTKRKSDLTNKAESVMDLLVDCEVLKDDNWFVVPKVTLTGSYLKNQGGAEIIIIP